MENGVVIDTEEGSPQGGNLSPLLANVYLNEFDQEFLKRGVPCIRLDFTAGDLRILKESQGSDTGSGKIKKNFYTKHIDLVGNKW